MLLLLSVWVGVSTLGVVSLGCVAARSLPQQDATVDEVGAMPDEIQAAGGHLQAAIS
jgi:hypothetical protein